MPQYTISKSEGTQSRTILRAMIVSTSALQRIVTLWVSDDMFSSPDANRIGKWCVDYFKEHKKAPKVDTIKAIYNQWQETHRDSHALESTTKALSVVLDEQELGEKIAPEFAYEAAFALFNKVNDLRMAEKVQVAHETGKPDVAAKAIADYQKISTKLDESVDLFNNFDEVASTYVEETSESLVKYEGALGVFFRNALERGKFIAFQAPEKTGKTFMLIDIAYRAVEQRKKTIFIGAGDMTKQEMKERILSRVTRSPLRSDNGHWPYSIDIPTKIIAGDLRSNSFKLPEVTTKEKPFDSPHNADISWKAIQKLINNKIRSKESYFKLACYPNDTISASGIYDVIKGWQMRGFNADVVVIDYADILAPMDKRKESRDQINETWKYLRKMSQELHCLLVTATQADAASYGKLKQHKGNFSEDKRKNAHVSCMIAIDTSDAEKEMGVVRLSYLAKRTGKSSSIDCWVAGCLDICDPCIVSTF